MTQILKIKFVDFGEGINPTDNFILNYIAELNQTLPITERYQIEFSDEPDFLFYSVFGQEFRRYQNCVKIFYTGENIVPNFNECDYALGFHFIDFEDRYFRHRNHNFSTEDIQQHSNLNDDLCRRKFCNFIYSNMRIGEGTVLRRDFCLELMRYKPVDCPGKVLNNMQNAITPRDGDWYNGKMDFIQNYKFTIAFENSSSNGYTTEKLIQPLQANSIPIYYGNPRVGEDFNTQAFIHCKGKEDFARVIQQIIELDNDDQAYMQMLRQSPISAKYDFHYQDKLLQFLHNIFQKSLLPNRFCIYKITYEMKLCDLDPIIIKEKVLKWGKIVWYRYRKYQDGRAIFCLGLPIYRSSNVASYTNDIYILGIRIWRKRKRTKIISAIFSEIK